MKSFKDFIKESLDVKQRKAEQIASRNRDNEFIGNELAKHDINASFGKPHDTLDGRGTIQTRVWVDSEHQDKAHKIIKDLGYHDTHKVASKMTTGGKWEEANVPSERKHSSVRWTGD